MAELPELGGVAVKPEVEGRVGDQPRSSWLGGSPPVSCVEATKTSSSDDDMT